MDKKNDIITVKADVELENTNVVMDQTTAYKKSSFRTINLHSTRTGSLVARINNLAVFVRRDAVIRATGVLETIKIRDSRNGGEMHLDFALKDSDGHLLQFIDDVINVYAWSGCKSSDPFQGSREYNANLYDAITRVSCAVSMLGVEC